MTTASPDASIVPARRTNRTSSQGIAVNGIVGPIATVAARSAVPVAGVVAGASRAWPP